MLLLLIESESPTLAERRLERGAQVLVSDNQQLTTDNFFYCPPNFWKKRMIDSIPR